MSDLIFRYAGDGHTLTVFERSKSLGLQTLCVLSEKELRQLYAWMGQTVFSSPDCSTTHLAKDR